MKATALQLAVMASRLANGGKAVQPKIFFDEENDVIAPENMGISQKNLNIVLQGMTDVFNHSRGTAFRYRLKDTEYKLAGKSGTTQVTGISAAERQSGVIKNDKKEWIGRDHALFVGFGPVEQPRYAVSVLLEHGGSGSTDASPVARDVLEYVIEQDRIRREENDLGQDV